MSLLPSTDEKSAQQESLKEYLGFSEKDDGWVKQLSKSGSLTYHYMSKLLISQYKEKKEINQEKSTGMRMLKSFASNVKYAFAFGSNLVMSFLEMIVRGLAMYMVSNPEVRLMKVFKAIFAMLRKLWNKQKWRSCKEEFWLDFRKIGSDKELKEGFVKSSQAFIMCLINFIRCILGQTLSNIIIVGVYNLLVNIIIKPLCKGIWKGVQWVFKGITGKLNGNVFKMSQENSDDWSKMGMDIKNCGKDFLKLVKGDYDMTDVTAYHNKLSLKGSKLAGEELGKALNNTPVTLIILDVLSVGCFGMTCTFLKKIFHFTRAQFIPPFLKHTIKETFKVLIKGLKYGVGVVTRFWQQVSSFFRKVRRHRETRHINYMSSAILLVNVIHSGFQAFFGYWIAPESLNINHRLLAFIKVWLFQKIPKKVETAMTNATQ